LFKLDAGDGGEAKADILSGDDTADGVGNRLGFESGSGDLVEEGDERVVVVLVEDGDVDERVSQAAGYAEASEAGADENDARPGRFVLFFTIILYQERAVEFAKQTHPVTTSRGSPLA
jgi:hypothetical protein